MIQWLPYFLSPLADLLIAAQVGLPPTLQAIRREPSILFHPKRLSRLFLSHVWKVFGAGIDENSAPIKQTLITPYARGVILDIGAGHGHSIPYVRREQIELYVALEPNEHMHASLRATLAKCGLSEQGGTAMILPFGAENVAAIIEAVGGPNRFDTILSILTFCSIPSAEEVIPILLPALLRPGGTLLLYEHCLSPVPTSQFIQRVWAPIWAPMFDGCRMDCDTLKWVDKVAWKERHVWRKEGEPDWHLFYHAVGRFVIGT